MLIKNRVDSNPEKGEKAPYVMRKGAKGKQNLPQCLLDHSCQAIPQEFLHPAFGSKKIIRCFAKKSPSYTLIVLGTEEASGHRWGHASQQMGESHHGRWGEAEGPAPAPALPAPSNRAFSYFTF